MIASVTYNTSGSVGPYSLTFPYLQKSDVQVYLDGVLSTLFTWPSATTVQLNTAPTATAIEIRRSTQVAPYVTFADPSSLRKDDLNTAELQALYIAQEAKDSSDRVKLEADATQTQLNTAVVVAGNVPAPASPGDNNKFLKANSGAFTWQPASVTAAQISDASSIGRTILAAADAAAVRTADGSAKQLTPVVLTAGASVTIDASLGDYFTLVANTASWTLQTPTNPTHGQRIMLRVKQDGTGSRVVTYGAGFRFGTDLLAAVLSTAINKTDYLGFVYDSVDTKWDVVAFVKGY
jgi:hypothetical protein